MKNIFLALIFIAVCFEVLADVLFKYWSINSKGFLLLGGVVLYTMGTVVWAFSLKHEYLSKAITIFTILNLIAIVLVGIFVFKENVSLVNKIGILLGIASVILMQL